MCRSDKKKRALSNTSFSTSDVPLKTNPPKLVQTTTQLPMMSALLQNTEAPVRLSQDFMTKIDDMIRLAQSNHEPTKPPK